jgi:hypothetical protein
MSTADATSNIVAFVQGKLKPGQRCADDSILVERNSNGVVNARVNSGRGLGNSTFDVNRHACEKPNAHAVSVSPVRFEKGMLRLELLLRRHLDVSESITVQWILPREVRRRKFFVFEKVKGSVVLEGPSHVLYLKLGDLLDHFEADEKIGEVVLREVECVPFEQLVPPETAEMQTVDDFEKAFEAVFVNIATSAEDKAVKYMQLQELQDAVGNAQARVYEVVEEMEQAGASDDDEMKVNVISFSSSSDDEKMEQIQAIDSSSSSSSSDDE